MYNVYICAIEKMWEIREITDCFVSTTGYNAVQFSIITIF